MSRVDVIMATYNGEQYLREQIDSILSNKGCKVILHVFDDGSTDSTMEILEEYKKKYPKQMEYRQNETNVGVTKNFLQGIRLVMERFHEAEYFMCCDQDDVWHEDKIIRTLKRMHQMEHRYGKERPLLVFTDAEIVDDNRKTIQKSFYKSQHLAVHKTDFAHLLMENKCIGCTTMINRSFQPYFFKTPEHARYHDWWMALIAAAFGEISYIPRQTLQYRQHSRNVVGGSKYSAYFMNRIKSIRKQKESLIQNKVQAEEFYEFYEELLNMYKKKLLEKFIMMYSSNWAQKRSIMISNGFIKSGISRNIGLFLVM